MSDESTPREPHQRKVGRPKTLNGRLPLFEEEATAYPRNAHRPRTRGDCAPAEDPEVQAGEVPGAPAAKAAGNHCRPCPWISCKYHLAIDVTKNGSLKVNWPADSLDGIVNNLAAMKETCALDVAERGEMTLEDIGALLNVTRERIRQMEERLLGKMRRSQSAGRVLGEQHLVDGELVDSDDFDDEFEPDEDDALAGLFSSLRGGGALDEGEGPPDDLFDG